MWISPGTPVGLLWTPGAGRAGQRAWHPSRSDAGAGNKLQPKGWASLLSHLSPQQGCKEPTSSGPACRDPGNLPAPCQHPGSPESSRSPIARLQPCRVWAAQAGGSLCPLLRARPAAWGEFPSLNPIPPRQAGVRCRFPWESPAPLPGSPGVWGAQARRGSRSCWQRCGGVGSWEQLPAGSGRSGSAAAWESPTQSQGCSCSQEIPVSPGAVTLSRMQGRESRRWQPRAEPWGWTGGRWPGVGESFALGRAPVAGRAGTAQPCLWLTAHEHG